MLINGALSALPFIAARRAPKGKNKQNIKILHKITILDSRELYAVKGKKKKTVPASFFVL